MIIIIIKPSASTAVTFPRLHVIKTSSRAVSVLTLWALVRCRCVNVSGCYQKQGPLVSAPPPENHHRHRQPASLRSAHYSARISANGRPSHPAWPLVWATLWTQQPRHRKFETDERCASKVSCGDFDYRILISAVHPHARIEEFYRNDGNLWFGVKCDSSGD
jgi:hypothetical protein